MRDSAVPALPRETHIVCAAYMCILPRRSESPVERGLGFARSNPTLGRPPTRDGVGYIIALG